MKTICAEKFGDIRKEQEERNLKSGQTEKCQRGREETRKNIKTKAGNVYGFSQI